MASQQEADFSLVILSSPIALTRVTETSTLHHLLGCLLGRAWGWGGHVSVLLSLVTLVTGLCKPDGFAKESF